ncbi:MAG TPA: GAF domain-containing protein, partial [Longimicrobiaceae bacterium]|nr:GAF domain-containing protein [Longimicrobiaceae bacterium]
MPTSANPDAAFGHLRDGVCLVAPDGGVRYANASFLEILELVGHEGPVEHIWDVLPGDGGGPDAELLRHSLEDRVPVCFRTDAGGSRVWQVEVEPAGRGDMRVRLRNVTAEVRAEAVERSGEALLTVAEREARLDAILESSPVGYVLMDSETFVVREANRASHEILEDPWRTPGSTVGHPMSELVPGFAASDIEEVFRRVRDTGEPFDVAEWEFRGFARGPAFFRWSLRAVPREGGGPPRFLLLLVVDVTAEVLARRAAETERRGLFAVLDALPVGVLVARAPGGETAYVNPAAATLAGRPAAELAAADEAEHAALWDGRHPSGERMGAGERPLARALRGEPVRDVELVLPRPDGGSRTVLASAEPLRGEGGEVERAVVSLHDVSDRRTLEEALVERTAAAEAAAGEAALRAEESRALREMGRALVSALDPEQVLRMAAASAMELTGARGSCVVSPRGAESMVLSPCVGLLERLEGTVLPLAGSAADVAVNAGRPVVFNSPEELPGGSEVLATARSLGLRNLLAAPMLAFGEALGVLVAVDREGGFGEDETRLLESFADSAALAVHNARLYEGQRRRAEENRALLAAAEALTSTLDPAEVMERIVHIARELVGADAAGLTLVTGENRDRLLTPVAVGLLEPFRGSEGALAGSLTEVAARASGPIVIDADAGEPLHPNAVFMQRLGIVYFAVLPLRVEGELLGMIGVANARGSRPFGAQDLRVLALLADQAVLAVRNARAHETARGASRAKSEFLAMMSHELRT